MIIVIELEEVRGKAVGDPILLADTDDDDEDRVTETLVDDMTDDANT